MPRKESPKHGQELMDEHFRGENEKGRPFVYCPEGNIVSWSPGDYANWWCHWCHQFFRSEIL